MSDTTTDQAGGKPTDEAGKPNDQAGENKPAGTDSTDWKAEARKWEQRAKENTEAAAELKKRREAEKTDEQRREEKAAKDTARQAELELKSARLEVALEHGLTARQAARLVGTTADELAADAVELVKELGQTTKAPARVTTTGKSGETPGDEPGGGTSRDALARSIFGLPS